MHILKETKLKVGILAYGSLLSDPGKELLEKIIERISVETPFKAEYARSSKNRDGAPTIVPVANGIGCKVNAKILVLNPNISEEEACNKLYRREINRIGDENIVYDDERQEKMKDAVIIKREKDFSGISTVLYTFLRANIKKVLEADVSAEEKAKELASLAIGSVTQDTFCSRRDGVCYLAAAIGCGIHTPLTDLYKQEILRQVGCVHNLEEARQKIAKNKGIFP
jgi:hypothetical protein